MIKLKMHFLMMLLHLSIITTNIIPGCYADNNNDEIIISTETTDNDDVEKMRALATVETITLADDAPRIVNVLALGGSNTYGAGDVKRHETFPYYFGEKFKDHDSIIPNVHNLGIRATGSAFTSMCISSMVNGNVPIHSDNDFLRQQNGETTYDVILLEFALSGYGGIDSLLTTLRTRYPGAMIIVIDLHQKLLLADGSTDFHPHYVLGPATRALMTELDVKIFSFRNFLRDPSLYQTNSIYLNDVGQYDLATNLYHTYKEDVISSINKNTRQIGNWVGGLDMCRLWLHSGDDEADGLVKKDEITVKQDRQFMEISEFSKGHFAYETHYPKDSRIFFYYNPEGDDDPNDNRDATIKLLYMVKGQPWNDGNPQVYPKCEVAHYVEDKNTVNQPEPKWETMSVEHIEPNGGTHHLTAISYVGIAKKNTWNGLVIRPIQDKDQPFRVVGIIIGKHGYIRR